MDFVSKLTETHNYRYFVVFLKILAEMELWYYRDISRTIAIQLLKEDGDFLLRYAESKKCFVLTTRWDGMNKHFIVRKTEDHVCFTLCCHITIIV